MSESYQGKVAIVTGGAKGVGAATVRSFVERGASVGVLDTDPQEGQKLVGELGSAALFVSCDVGKVEQVDAAVKRVTDHFGRLDVLVNNAGIVRYGAVA